MGSFYWSLLNIKGKMASFLQFSTIQKKPPKFFEKSAPIRHYTDERDQGPMVVFLSTS